jgi:thiamine-phosphate pyrophosphorylase
LALLFSLLLITDRRNSVVPLPAAVEAALATVPPGVAAVQLREKDLGGRALAELALGLDGVHLARTSIDPVDARKLLGPASLIGVSCHSTAEVAAACGSADYATLGPLFDTPSKREYGPPLGPEVLAEARPLALPLYALGGITPARVEAVREAHGLAAIGAALGARDPGQATAALWRAWQERR